jgi:hypothetical protein
MSHGRRMRLKVRPGLIELVRSRYADSGPAHRHSHRDTLSAAGASASCTTQNAHAAKRSRDPIPFALHRLLHGF